MNWYNRHITLATFSGMFFWWACILLYFSLRWEGILVYLIGLIPALALCLVLGWAIDRVGIIKSWWGRPAAGYALNWLAHTIWHYSTDAACIARGIRLGTDGPFVLGAMAVTWINLFALVMFLIWREHSTKKVNSLPRG